MLSAVVLRGLTKLYGKQRGVLDLDLDVRRGEVFGYLGPNGAGKTTTIRLLLDLIRPTSGSATLLGGLDGAHAEELAERLELELDRPIRSLSHGNKQKVGLVQAFAHRPELLVLDEPTAGLDPLMQQVFHGLVRESIDAGATVFLSSHVLSEVQEVADRAGIVREGRLVAVEDVGTLRERSMRRFQIRFPADAPAEVLRAVPGVRELQVEGPVAQLLVEGSPDALVKVLARHEVQDLTSHEPDLEEVFLSYYADAR